MHVGSALLMILLLVILALILVHLGISKMRGAGKTTGGDSIAKKQRQQKKDSENIVVDTLNLTHWLRRRTPLKKAKLCDTIAAIDETAEMLRERFPGQVIYVTKDRKGI